MSVSLKGSVALLIGLAFALGPALARPVHAQAPPAQLFVQPQGASFAMTAASETFGFTIINTEAARTVNLVVSCSGAVTSCTLPSGANSGTLALGASSQTTQTVNFTATLGGGAGVVKLAASDPNSTLTDTGSLDISSTYGVTVVAALPSVTAAPGASGTASFTVTNSGTLTNTYTFAASCAGTSVASCATPSPASATIAGGSSTTVTLGYVASGISLATGSVGIAATGTSTTGGASTTLTTSAAPGLVVAPVNPGVSFNRANCLAVAMAPHTAMECGDIRITHPLPTSRTYNKARAPTLIYNSRLANPQRNVSALLTVQASAVGLTSVTGKLSVSQHGVSTPPTVVSTGIWPGSNWGSLASQTTMQIQLPWTPPQTPQGLYDYTFSTILTFANGTTAQDSAQGQFIYVNRYDALFFANGWSLAGLEQIQVVDSAIVWINGDGSTQLYVPSGTANVWVPKTYVFGRDSITYDGSTYYTRHAPHGDSVQFNTSGQHVATINRLRHKTTFAYDTYGRLSQITLPTPSGNAAMYYAFSYDTNFALKQVSAPGPNGVRRLVTVTTRRLVKTAASSILEIQDPDNSFVTFSYTPEADTMVTTANTPVVIHTRTDKRSATSTFAFDAATMIFVSDTLHMQGTGIDVEHRFTFPGFGMAGSGVTSPAAVNPESTYVVFRDPRANIGTDSLDVTTFWLDQWWQPTRIKDAHGSVTAIQRHNIVYPDRVTRVQDPLGRVQVATYDQRGNDSTVTDSSFQDVYSRYPTWRYVYSPLWDFVTLIDPPLHDSTSITYDATYGNRLTQRDARGDSTRVTYNYGNTYALVSSVQEPDGARDSVLYDAVLGNVAQTITPLGITTTYTTDQLGRDSILTTLADTGKYLHIYSYYDAMDRVDSTVSAGDSIMILAGPQSLHVWNYYDNGGNLIKNIRLGVPDVTSIGSIITRWNYDLANRPTRVYAPDSTPTDSLDNPYDSTQYDASGNTIAVVTRRGDTIRTIYDALERPLTRAMSAYRYASRLGRTDSSYIQAAAAPGLPTGADTVEYTSPFPRYPNDAVNNPGGYTVFADTVRYGYDALGRLIRADNHDALIRRHYLLNGLLAADTLKVRPVFAPLTGWDTTAHAYGQQYTYNLDSRRIALIYPSQFGELASTDISYGYDQAGQMDSLGDAMASQFIYHYDAEGRLQSWATVPTGATASFGETYQYDADGKLALDSAAAGGTVQRHTRLVYDVAGKLRLSQNTAWPFDTVASNYTGLGYVSSGYLDSYQSLGGVEYVMYQDVAGYQYDAFGNRDSTRDNATIAYTLPCAPSVGICQYSGGAGGDMVAYTYGYGTGRLATAATNYMGRLDSTYYDRSGNIMYENGAPPGYAGNVVHGATWDKTSYYGSDGKLHAADHRNFLPTGASTLDAVFEEYRYDALGRRVLVYTHHFCSGNVGDDNFLCGPLWVKRTVWDGMAELGEIQMPGDSTNVELDHGVPTGVPTPQQPAGYGFYLDLYPFYGEVLYAYGPQGLDRPQSLTRASFTTATTDSSGSNLAVPWTIPAYDIVPFWDWHGDAVFGNFAPITRPCEADSNGTFHCALADWPGLAFGYERPGVKRRSWQGSLVEDKQDAAGTYYRRNRYYDPNTGRFTQEDPSGLAGGINAYGFANGDPVNYSDPFGLCPNPDGSPCGLDKLIEEARSFARGVADGLNGPGALILEVAEPELIATPAPSGEAVGETLSRLGVSKESVTRLARMAADAEDKLGVHGVSVTAGEPIGPASTAARDAVETQFQVHDTPSRQDPLHRTIELPKPVTKEVANIFNQLFGRTP